MKARKIVAIDVKLGQAPQERDVRHLHRLRGLVGALREAPATLPMAGVLVLLLAWDTGQAGYPLTHWAPGGVLVLALLAIACVSVGSPVGTMPKAVRIAVLGLAAFTALSFCSILWAGVPGDAWEGADRTLLYLLIFVLFAGWRQGARSATALLCVWTLATAGIAIFVAIHVGLAASNHAEVERLLPGGRLIYPAGYANATAAQWMIAFWPALLMARSERLHALVRGLLAGGAVWLAELALLSQSRGSFYATPIMLALVFAVLPSRTKTLAMLVPVGAAIGAAAPWLLHVGDAVESGHHVPSALHSALAAMAASSVLAGAVVGISAWYAAKHRLSGTAARRAHLAVGAAGLATLGAIAVAALIAFGNPVARAEHAWDTFKSGSGYAANGSGNRLVSGLGSNRYDFYRVALDQFTSHPLAGIGADNFAQQYLRGGRSEETPKYPHSVELRTLAQTGILGTLIALVGLAGALVAGMRALKAPDPLGRAVAAAALGGFAYWVVHGSVDWFFEFAGLAGPAFALLGLACALAPGPTALAATTRPVRTASAGVGVLGWAACALTLLAPWLAQREIQGASRIWTSSPTTAIARLHDAARLNPLSDEPYLIAGDIDVRVGDLAGATSEFERALARVPKDAYATLELGAIDSAHGLQAQAVRILHEAVVLAPRDQLARGALREARTRRTIGLRALDLAILRNAQQLS